MAARLARDLRPLGAIRNRSGGQPILVADRLTKEFLGVIVEEVDRLNRVVLVLSCCISRAKSRHRSAAIVARRRLLPRSPAAFA
jgi:hypothetical protein